MYKREPSRSYTDFVKEAMQTVLQPTVQVVKDPTGKKTQIKAKK